jgi:transposase
MMGHVRQRESKLFYTSLSLDERVGQDNRYRRLGEVLDFSFLRPMVAGCYGWKGHESEDPIVIMKLMIILFIENIPSERELMRRLPERLDWLWFCEFDLDDALPDHSVPSKARRRWGLDAFEAFFQVVLTQCMHAGLVDGETIHIDSSLINGDVSVDSLRPAFAVLAQQTFRRLEEACAEPDADTADSPVAPTPESSAQSAASVGSAPIGAKTKLSTTDPEARCRRKGKQEVIGYQEHRVVDDAYGIITASETTDASVAEGRTLETMVEQHKANTDSEPVHVAADKAYGTAENYQHLQEQGITPCIPHKHHTATNTKAYPRSKFKYVAEADHCICPAGQLLKRQSIKPNQRGQVIYRAKASICHACEQCEACFGGKVGKQGKSVCRNTGQAYIDWADGCLPKAKRRQLLARRKSVVEGSFGDAATHHGFKRSRWRSWLRMKIQNRLIATLQNLRKLVKYGPQKRRGSASKALNTSYSPVFSAISTSLLVLRRYLSVLRFQDRVMARIR